MSSTTRERIVDEAMRLFSARGYRGTSVTEIEAAAGLSPGAGGIYHHFPTKESVLQAGIERHLARLEALRDIRDVLTPLADLRAELTVMARFVLRELRDETPLLRILISELGNRPQALTESLESLISSTLSSFAGWLGERMPGTPSDADKSTLASLAIGSLISSSLLGQVLGLVALEVNDEKVVETWVRMMVLMLEQPELANSDSTGSK
jgi:AcrR family transcriptional regulator